MNQFCEVTDDPEATPSPTSEPYVPPPDPTFPYDPCDDESSALKQRANQECAEARQRATECCDKIGTVFCDDLMANCAWDSCFASEGDENQIFNLVAAIVTDPIEDECDVLVVDEENFEEFQTMAPTKSPTVSPTIKAPTTSPTDEPTPSPTPSPTDVDECRQRVVYHSGPHAELIPTRYSDPLFYLDVTGDMTFELDVTVNAIPPSWASVFHCGNENSMRMPGIWMHPDSDDNERPHQGFTVVFSTIADTNKYSQKATDRLEAGDTYHLEIKVTQNSFVLMMNDQEQLSDYNYGAHHLHENVPCYLGDPWYVGADVVVKHLKVITECPEPTPSPTEEPTDSPTDEPTPEPTPSPTPAPVCHTRTLYDSGDAALTLVKNTVLTHIPITDSMHYSMEITVNSLPSTTWQGIFSCGEGNHGPNDRMPGVWLNIGSTNPNHGQRGFHVMFSTKVSANPTKQSPVIKVGQTYKLEIILTQTMKKWIMDGVVFYENNNDEAHNTFDSKVCWLSDPWYTSADVTVRNLVIKDECWDGVVPPEVCHTLEGNPSIIWGDPHTTTFAGVKHDFQE